ncbi:interferon-induced very large GTPase 1-like [Ostrea edulis]|uniref:interferon-induced very large GTPase 1-like n=1 Tax=Ostrea edulis TaxID=37623 RepID=UPI0024AED03F|nr:interferon-induced very large GTPase 1-like [Ostrea edulis]XP_056002367.1 interferon-induced very large GTPase 1-like [Ostrea edulis]XP_056002368.1 interferon-induced very large GTPase 1-like [Ostrea edulis]
MGKDVDKKSAQDDCISFFKMFGTHVYLTNVTVGGIFSISAQTALQKDDDAESTKDLVQQVHNKAISDNLFKDTKTGSTGIEENGNETCTLQNKIETAHRKLGGPQNTSYFTEWKSELMKNPETWTVSDMGEISFENCIGIWSLVRKHSKYFSNAEELSCFLAQIWMDHVAHGLQYNHVLSYSWQSFVEPFNSNVSAPSSASWCLESLRDLLQFLEHKLALVGKPMVIKAVDVFSEPFVQALFKESAKHETPKYICFQILTTKLKILQIDNGKSSVFGASWIASDYFIPGMLSQREVNNVEELLNLLESELLPGIGVLQVYHDIDLEKVQSLAKSEIKTTVHNFLQRLIDRNEYREALLLLVIFISIGYHFKREEILTNITFELLEDFISYAKGEISLAKKLKNRINREAWLLLRMIFKLDTNYRIYDASIVLADEINKFVCFLKENNFIFHSNIKNVIDSEHKKDCPHGIIHSLAEISKFPCELFDDETMKTVNSKNPESRPDSGNSDALHHLIQTFGMEKFFPQKLSTEDILKLSDALLTSPKTLKDIPWAIFQHAIAINYNFREKVLSDFLKKANAVQPKRGKQNSKKKHNPMDVFLALWHCCDPFLKKNLASKIATCQLALPLIYEDITSRDQLMISLWPIRDIFIDDSPDSVLTKPLNTVSFIRVGDLKSISKSRIINKLIRGENNEHSTFYHRDCALASNKRLFSNGLVEITWNVPRTNNADDENSTETGEELEEFLHPLCILNMRGDAKDFRTQLLALLTLSDVVVVMSEYKNLKDEQSLELLKQVHSSSSVPIIMSDFPDIEGNLEEETEEESDGKEGEEEDEKDEEDVSPGEHYGEDLHHFYKEQTGLNHPNTLFLSTLDMGKTLNENDLKDCLTTQIISALKRIKFPESLERKKLLLPSFVSIDEDNANSRLGLNLSATVFADVEFSANVTLRKQIKDKVLPLQGEHLWHTWCMEQKQYFRSGKKSVLENIHPQHVMKTLRLWQVMYGLETQNTIVKFLNVLASHIDDRRTITYFLQYMKFHMDCQSRHVIPKLSNDLYQAFREYETLRSQSGIDEKKIETMKSQIKSAEENLAKASFGLEHFFREMGQIYESFMYCNDVMFIRASSKTKLVIAKMPLIAAKLLYWGHPLEIMDGDAASVPECWIKAVFKEIRSVIGENKTVYVISVLGIQSSGKSTLLNTMFGLQFSVSAGRCTRGIYAQLIPVDKSQSSLKFDYALVIDTEGLRAPELAGEKFNHDNELATLVIGLADVALVNIKGETIADMQDVLQIVVHALMRLKNANEELNIKQSCVFVHQNVSASNAKRSTFQGSQKVTSVLDEMTKYIAEQEKMANTTRFTDVIAFNPVTNVIHVPDLWQGIPPMAPASPEYSKQVVQVAKCILGDICENKTCFLNIQNTSLHLQNLWKGILSEDFVFSFRNALEVKAFTSLEMKFQNFVWTLEELKLQYLQNKLGRIGCSETSEKLQSTITNIRASFHESLQEKTDECDKELQMFFDTSDLSHYMIHWRARKTEELRAISKKIETEIDTKIESEKGKCETLFQSNEKFSLVKKGVTSKAIEFAKSAKYKTDEMSKTEVNNKFESLWKEWLNELAPEVSQNTIQNKIEEMKSQIDSEIRKKFSNQKALYMKISDMKVPSAKVLPKLKDCIKTKDLDEKDIEVTGIVEKMKCMLGKYLPEKIKEFLSVNDYFKKAKDMLDVMFTQIEKYMEIQREDVEYNSAQFIQVLKYITEGFHQHNHQSGDHEFMVTTTLEIKTVLVVQRYAIKHFEQHITKYETDNSLRSKMAKYKNEVESLFVGMYFQTANEEIATSMISEHLENALRNKVLNELSHQIWKQVTGDFGNRKEPLIKAVLTDLAQKHNFSDYIFYIRNPKFYVKLWIEKYTNDVFNRKTEKHVSEFQRCIETYLERSCDTIQECATVAGSKSKKGANTTHWKNWIDCFKENLSVEDFHLSNDSFQTLLELEVENFDNLFKNIERQLNTCRKSLLGTLKDVHMSHMKWGDTNPFEKIMTSLWRCDKNCPWCYEPCVVSSSEDRHSCKQHRPSGIGGIPWKETGKLVFESCNFKVQSAIRRSCGSWCKCDPKTEKYHPYRAYKKHMKEPWDISGSPDMASSKYWTWVFREFEKDFVQYYHAKPPDFPESDALKITKEEAIVSLSVYE